MLRKGGKNIKIQAGGTDHHGYQTGENKRREVKAIKQVHLKRPTNSHWEGKWTEPRGTAEGDVGKT